MSIQISKVEHESDTIRKNYSIIWCRARSSLKNRHYNGNEVHRGTRDVDDNVGLNDRVELASSERASKQEPLPV
jgi:hypothetical protein